MGGGWWLLLLWLLLVLLHRSGRQTERQTDKQTDRQTDTHTHALTWRPEVVLSAGIRGGSLQRRQRQSIHEPHCSSLMMCERERERERGAEREREKRKKERIKKGRDM